MKDDYEENETKLTLALTRLREYEIVERDSVSCGMTFHHDPFNFEEMREL